MKSKKSASAISRTENIRAAKKLKSGKATKKSIIDSKKHVQLIDPRAGKLIAITGGIGSGKTFVLNYLEKLGFIIFNADKAIHSMLLPGADAYNKVIELFPEVLCTNNEVDREILGNLVFEDLDKLKMLEAILHPKLREAQQKLVIDVKKVSNKSIVFEIPLLFENKRSHTYDFVILTTAQRDIRKKRVMLRNNMTEEKFNAIIEAQVSDKIRLKGSHFVIKTDISDEDTHKQMKAIIKNENPKRNSSRYGDNRPLRKKR